jgi:Raf kinase inhibitor-like YbhB/YbcL family protein
MSLSKFMTVGLAMLCAVALADTSFAQGGGGGGGGRGGGQQGGGPPVLAMTMAPAKANGKLTVTSTAFQNGGSLEDKYTQNGANVSPALSWTRGPAGTQSYVLITEDSGVDRPNPIIHWVIYDIPATATGLPEAVPPGAMVANPAGAMQGNAQGNNPPGFRGPRPPAGQTHPYHFQVFALDNKLNLDPAMATRQAVIDAMKDHVLASGEAVANYTGK